MTVDMYKRWAGKNSKGSGAFGLRALWNLCRKCLYPVPEQEVIHYESDPAECEDADREEDLSDDAEAGLLEDVEDAPYSDHDTEDVDNLC